MASHSKECLIIISIILIIIGILEIKRGYGILKGKRYHPSVIDKMRNGLSGEILQDQIENAIFDNGALSKDQKKSAYNSIVGGIVYVILFTIMLIYALMR